MFRNSIIRIGRHNHLFSNHVSTRKFNFAATMQGVWQSLSESTPVYYMQEGLIQFHDLTGLPWWASIIASTVALRVVVTLPTTIYQNKIIGRINKITEEMPTILEDLKKETAIAIKKFGLTEQEAQMLYIRSAKKQWNNLIVRENCHPSKTGLTVWFQIPLWVIQSVAIRNIHMCLPNPNSLQAQIAVTELTVGGFGWIPNLTIPDASWILPVALGVINLLIIQIQTSLRKGTPMSKFQTFLTNMFRVMVVLMVPIGGIVPSGLCLYWVTSSTYGLVQNLAFISPRVRRILGVPQFKHLPTEKPYQHLVKQIFSGKVK